MEIVGNLHAEMKRERAGSLPARFVTLTMPPSRRHPAHARSDDLSGYNRLASVSPKRTRGVCSGAARTRCRKLQRLRREFRSRENAIDAWYAVRVQLHSRNRLDLELCEKVFGSTLDSTSGAKAPVCRLLDVAAEAATHKTLCTVAP